MVFELLACKNRYGAEIENGKKAYDVVVVDEGSGGVLLFKGTDALLTEKDCHCWSAMALAISDSANLVFEASAGGASEPFRVWGSKKIPYHQWVHVAVTMSKVSCHAKTRALALCCCLIDQNCFFVCGLQLSIHLYLNGELDAQGTFDENLLHVSSSKRASVDVETMHPYVSNMDTYWPIEVEGAESYTITFHENSRTERNYDWCTFYAWGEVSWQEVLRGKDGRCAGN